MTTPTSTLPPSPEVPIVEDEPQDTRRLQALLIAHHEGVVSYITTCRDANTGELVYPVMFAGQVYMLHPDEVLIALYFMAASIGPETADKLAYRRGLRAGEEHASWAAHQEGTISYLATTTAIDPATDEPLYPVRFAGAVYLLRATELPQAFYFMAASVSGEAADRLSYRPGMRHGAE